jgi:hypothetical protein
MLRQNYHLHILESQHPVNCIFKEGFPQIHPFEERHGGCNLTKKIQLAVNY